GLPPGCAISSGIGTAIVTIACAIASLGIPVGTVITETVSEPSVAAAQSTPFITQSVTYNANGAAPQVPIPTTNPGTCTPAVLPPGFSGSFTCTNTTAVTTVGGGTLSVAVSSVGGGSLQIANAPNTLGPALGPCFISAA